tara:strand:- start:80 stop:646 length:567 start_codon:yes stop_codon:yes gene_type:complete
MILIVDNYDSFTYNIVQYVGEISNYVTVLKNDEIDINSINNLNFSHVIISPGPGSPSDTGLCKKLVRKSYKHTPILGICMGHQVIGEVFGCKVKKNKIVCHGKVSNIYHNKKSKLFLNIPQKFNATRYHSLIIDRDTISSELIVNSWLDDATVMGVEHIKYPLFGVQFHPESILTKYGKKIIENFLKQ